MLDIMRRAAHVPPPLTQFSTIIRRGNFFCQLLFSPKAICALSYISPLPRETTITTSHVHCFLQTFFFPASSTMTEPLSIISATTVLTALAQNLASQLSTFISAFPDAPEDTHHAPEELSSLCQILGQLETVLIDDPTSSSPFPPEVIEALRTVLDRCIEIFEKFLDFIQAVDRGDWGLSENQVGAFRRELEAHRATLSIAVQLGTMSVPLLPFCSLPLITSTVSQHTKPRPPPPHPPPPPPHPPPPPDPKPSKPSSSASSPEPAPTPPYPPATKPSSPTCPSSPPPPSPAPHHRPLPPTTTSTPPPPAATSQRSKPSSHPASPRTHVAQAGATEPRFRPRRRRIIARLYSSCCSTVRTCIRGIRIMLRRCRRQRGRGIMSVCNCC